jgi:hypothetical protein
LHDRHAATMVAVNPSPLWRSREHWRRCSDRAAIESKMLRRYCAEQREVMCCNHARRTALTQRRCQAFGRSEIEAAERLIGDQQIR